MPYLLSSSAARQTMRGIVLPRGGHAHLVGIAGSGMKALATALDASGWRISGSDLRPINMLPAHWRTACGHSVDHLLPLPDMVLHSPAIESDNVELAAARRHGIPVVSYPKMLGQLMSQRMGIAIAGTHGKSTTVAMMASIFETAGLDPTVIVGADGLAGRQLSRHGHGPHMLVEACEYRSSFLHLRPQRAAILNLEADHFDYFTSAEHREHEFAQFAKRLPANGLMLVPADCPVTRSALENCEVPLATFGLRDGSDWQARIHSVRLGRYQFEVLANGRACGSISLRIPGRHNVLNALAAAALADDTGISWPDIRRGLERFCGIRRRLETVGVAGDITFLDDYAHHPTAITAALATVRQMHPGRKIWCVFEPHQASRTKSLLDELAASLQNADTLAVAEIFRAREPAWQTGDVTAADLAARARQLGAQVASVHRLNDIEAWLLHQWRRGSLATGDVIVTLGAGQIGTLAHGVYQRIRENCAGE